MLTEREKNILKYIVEEYVNTAQPVGSSYLVKKYRLDISPATVRNTMMSLEKKGYVVSPHTSAGRVPTEKGYKFYISSEFVDSEIKKIETDFKKMSVKYLRKLKQYYKERGEISIRDVLKCMAKVTAEEVKNAVIVAFDKNDVYFTGISYLLSHPEYKDDELLYNISATIDRVDEILNEILDELPTGLNILIGSDNPFADDSAFIGFKYQPQRDQSSLVGILGPMRMPYIENIERIEFLKNFLVRDIKLNF